jgi:hypothetical protein
MSKLSGIPTESTFALTDFLVKIKADAAGDVAVTLQNAINNAISPAWTSWTPTWTNLTIGNAVVVARYQQVGKTVRGRIEVTLGSTSSVSASVVSVSMPVTAQGSGAFAYELFGTCAYFVSSVAFPGYLQWKDLNSAYLLVANVTNTYPQTTGVLSTVPAAWGSPPTGQTIAVTFSYEAA